MARDPSPDEPQGSRKRRAIGKVRDDVPSAEAGGSITRRRAADNESAAILRGALEFRRQTGLMPTRSNMPEFYDFLRGSIRSSLSQEQIYNKVRNLQRKFNQLTANGQAHHDGLVHELAAKLWTANDGNKGKKKASRKMQKKIEEEAAEEEEVEEEEEEEAAAADAVEEEEEEEEKEEEMKKDDEDGEMEMEEDDDQEEEPQGGPESYPYLAHAAAENWKAYESSNELLQEGLKRLNPSDAKALEAQWKQLLDDEIMLQAEWSKICGDILVLLSETHRE